jgi:hypothetical protein
VTCLVTGIHYNEKLSGLAMKTTQHDQTARYVSFDLSQAMGSNFVAMRHLRFYPLTLVNPKNTACDDDSMRSTKGNLNGVGVEREV